MPRVVDLALVSVKVEPKVKPRFGLVTEQQRTSTFERPEFHSMISMPTTTIDAEGTDARRNATLRPRTIPALSGYLTVTEAALILGVCANTLRAWDANGKLRATRHPMNGYRLYRRETLESFLEQLERDATTANHQFQA
ncbi:MAG: helix-turn-helix domain-containing protein [Phycisphaerae bacterium]|nr:helix-turn-helix domain-containing protein [Phycisphaerae bacterium]